jgi:hypothetical protein
LSRPVEANQGSVLLEPLEALTPEQVRQVDEALASVGAFGEVRLVKVKGKLRFIQRLESRDLLRRGAVETESR